MTALTGDQAYAAANLEAMQHAKTYQAAMVRLVVDKLKLGRATGRFLDFGAGRGDYIRALASQTSLDWIALEPDERLHEHFPPGIPRVTDVADLPAIQGAVSLNVFEHIANDVAVLRALTEGWAPGTPMLILVPAHPQLWTAMDHRVGHLRRYTPARLRALVCLAGLDVADEGWFDRTGYFATIIRQCLPSAKTAWTGDISGREVRLFDRLFSLVEPVLARCGRLKGKNRWVLAVKP